jgi:hypothetical protein
LYIVAPRHSTSASSGIFGLLSNVRHAFGNGKYPVPPPGIVTYREDA